MKHETAVKRLVHEWNQISLDGREQPPGADWYAGNWRAAQIMAGIPGGWRRFFALLVAITSPGHRPRRNLQLALRAFDHYQRTGDFPLLPVRFPAINLGLQRLIQLQAKEGLAALIGTNSEGAPPSLLASVQAGPRDRRTILYAQQIFGPKVGAFFGNLAGNHYVLTADMWWCRTWRRIEQRRGPDSPRSRGEYLDMQDAAREAAWRVGVVPSTLQACLWVRERELARRAGRKVGPTETFFNAACELFHEGQDPQQEEQDGHAVQA